MSYPAYQSHGGSCCTLWDAFCDESGDDFLIWEGVSCYLVIGEAGKACCQIREAEILWSGDIDWSRDCQFACECTDGGTCAILTRDPALPGRTFWNEQIPFDEQEIDEIFEELGVKTIA